MTGSSCARAQVVRRLSTLLHLFLSLSLCSVFAHGQQCAAPAIGPTVPAAPILDPQILDGASYATGTGIPGDTLVICVDGKQTNPATTTTVGPNNTFKVLINGLLTTGQQITAQQNAPVVGGAAPVYSALSNVVNAGEVTECLEALQSGECQFRVTINTSAAVGNNSQTNTNTVPNIMVTLDYQWHPPQDKNGFQTAKKTIAHAKGVAMQPTDMKTDRIPWLTVHFTGKTGFTQTFAASSVQPTPTTTGGATPACPKDSQAPSSTNCTLAVSKPSFLAELGGKIGATTAVDNAGFYGEFGAGGRGSFQYLIPTNQIVQNNGASYIDLNAINSHNTVGFYEATGYAAIAQHDRLVSQWKAENSSPLLIIESGYQNNRALQQLLPASPRINTRSRYMGRFTFNYEVSHSTHSQISLGMEYSGGIHGGPPILQLFVGGNLNPAKLFGGQ